MRPRADSGQTKVFPMQDRPEGWGALLSGGNGIRSLALAGGVALHAVNVFIATTILPSVVADIGGLDYYAWSTTLFVAASIVGAALSARLLQGLGPRGAYAAAALIFGLGSMACALAPTMPALLAGRIVQGLGGGFLFALSYAMIRIVFAPPLWPRGMALVSGMWGVATLVGPAVGGIFAELGAWRLAFWSVVPVTALFGLMAVVVLPKRETAGGGELGLPLLQLVLLTLAILAISLGSIRSGLAWTAAGLLAAILLLALIARVERRTASRLLPQGAFSLATPLGLAFASITLLTVAVTGAEVFVPLFLQVLHGQSPLAAGYLAAAMAGGWTTGSIASSGISPRAVARAMIVSPLVTFAGMALLALLMPQAVGGWLFMACLLLGLALAGLGVGYGWPHLLTRVLKVAPAAEQDLASASITTVQLFASALGAALAGMIANLAGLTSPGGVAGTASAAFWLFAILAAAPAAAALVALRSARLAPAAGALVVRPAER